jgi:predicted kinase
MNIYILRAGSGAGKSTWTKNNHPNAMVFSADSFFMVDGEYKFDPAKLGEAHGQCLRNFITTCQTFSGVEAPTAPSVVVDNTNTTLAEFGPYAQVGLAYGHNVTILTFIYDPLLAFARNTHGTPLKACIDMHARLMENTKLIPPWWKHDYVNANIRTQDLDELRKI